MPITTEIILFGLAVFGAIAGLWWRVEAKIDGARSAAHAAASALADYKTHVAETYVTKDGLRELFAQVMEGVADLKRQVSHISSRVDSLVDQQRSASRRRTGASE